MKKILLLFLIIILSLLFFLLFNDKGNEYLKPYVGLYLESKSEQNISVQVEHLKIDLKYVELTALLNKLTTINAYGEVLLLDKELNIDYNINSDGFKNESISFNNKVDINGTIKGTFDNMLISGQGDAFQSHLNYDLNYQDEAINNINIKMFKADISELLLLATQPAYAKGKIDIDVNIPSFDINNTQGKAHIVLYDTKLNEKIINKEFKIKLPKNTSLKGTIDSDIKNNKMLFNATINSNLATIKLNKTHYDLKSNNFSSNYNIHIPKLSKLAFISEKKLFGTLNAIGSLESKNKLFTLHAHTKSLGGTTKISLIDNKINVNLNNTTIEKILHLLGEKVYTTGKISGDVKLTDLKNLKGTFKLTTSQAKTVHTVLKKEFDIDFKKSLTFELKGHGKIKSNVAYIDATLNSKLLNFTSTNLRYNLDTSALQTVYLLQVPELSHLRSITKTELYGAMQLEGELKLNNENLTLNAITHSLGGETQISLNDNQANVKIQHTKIEKLLDLIGEKTYATGSISGEANFNNLDNLTGTFNLRTSNSKMIHQTLKKEFSLDLGKSLPFQMKSKGTIQSNIVTIESQLNSDFFNVTSHDIIYNLKKSLLTASYHLNIPKLSNLNTLAGKNLKGKLSINGTIKSNKSLLLTGNSNDLGGLFTFKLQDQRLTSSINGVSVQQLMYMLDYPQIFKAPLHGDFNYNLKTAKGTFNSRLTQAQLLPNTLTQLVQQVRGIDLTKERYNKTTFIAHLNKDDIHFDFNAESRKVLIRLPNGHINKLSNRINANYKLKIENKDIEGRIQGNISKPHITVDSSKFIQTQVIETIKDNIGEERLKELGIGKKETEVIKNILGDLFK